MFNEYLYELIASIIFLTFIIIYFLTRKFEQEEQDRYAHKKTPPKDDDIEFIPDARIAEEEEELEEDFTLSVQEEGSFGEIKNNPFETNTPDTTENEKVYRQKIPVPQHGKITKENFKDFNGVKLLVAEDNLINQKVIDGLLNTSGIEITIADDGQIALDILENNSDFHMVLMDVHMPRVDGFEATRMIRANPKYEHIVVVALSGDIAVDDIRRMKEAGMQEHLEKPLRMEALYDILYAYTKSQSVSNDNPPIEVIMTQELNGDKGLEICGNDEKFYKDILNEFLLTYTDTSNRLLELLGDGKVKLADALLLDFIGITANIGADRIKEVALDLKELISDSEEKSYVTILDDFEIHLEILLRDIRNYLA